MVAFRDGVVIKEAYVTIDGVEYAVVPAQYRNDRPPISAQNLNRMQVDLNNKINELLIKDKWQDIILNKNWNNYGKGYYNAQYKVIGNQVFFRGIVLNSDNNTNKIIFTVPEEVRPLKNTYVVLNMNDAFLSAYIEPSGNLIISNYTKGNWIDLSNASFFID